MQYSMVQFTRYFIKMCVHSKSVSRLVIGSTRRDKAVSDGVGMGCGKNFLSNNWVGQEVTGQGFRGQ